MSTTYSYILGTDFKNATQIDIPTFQSQIQASAISSATVQYMIQTNLTVTIYFSNSLSGGDLTILNNLVTNYIYVAPTDGQSIDTVSVQTMSNKSLTTSCEWIDETNNSKKLALLLSGMSPSTTLTISTSIAASRTYTIPDTGTTSSFIMTDSTGTQSITTGNISLTGASATLALSGASSVLTLANTAASTSSTTGALRCAGGAYFGANSLYNANITMQGTSAVLALSGASSALTLANTTASTSSTTGALRCAGGAYFGANSLYNANITIASPGSLITNNTIAATSNSSGSILCQGGAYFGNDCLFIGNINLTAASNFINITGANGYIRVANTENSTNNATGALRLGGGLYAGGNCLFFANVTLGAGSGSLFLTGATGILRISNPSFSTSNVSGCLQCTGGGFLGNLFIGGFSTITSVGTLIGPLFNAAATNITLSSSSDIAVNSFQASTLSASSTQTTTNAYSVYISGAPTAGTNQTITNSYALGIASGNVLIGGNLLLNANITLQGASAILALSGASSVLTLANTAASTSSTTGALRCAGGAYFGANSLYNANITLQGASAVLALSGTNSIIDMANTAISTSITTGAIQCAGGIAVKNIWLAGVSFTNQAVSLNGPLFNVPATTITATNTADMAFMSIQQPTLANSVAASTTVNASTLYIANAPAAGTNQTITNSYSLYVANGNCFIGSFAVSTSNTTGALVINGGIGCNNNIYASNLYLTNNFPCQLNINCNGSQVNPGQIVFSGSGGSGDFRIGSDGGDIYWQGGGGRALQMGGFHEIFLLGGRNTTSPISYINGTNANNNTIILNTNNSIGLVIRGVFGQTSDLQQWQNNTANILSRILSDGSMVISATAASTSSTTGALQCAGGAYFGANSLYNANITLQGAAAVLALSGASSALTLANTTASTSSTTGALRCAGGAYFGNNVVFNNGFTLTTGATNDAILISNATGDASWSANVPLSALNLTYYYVTTPSTTTFSTSSGTPVNITGLTLTVLESGTYFIMMMSRCTSSTNTRTITTIIAVDGTAITASSNNETTRIANQTFCISNSTIQSLSVNAVITGRMGFTGGSGSGVTNYNYLFAIRLTN